MRYNIKFPKAENCGSCRYYTKTEGEEGTCGARPNKHPISRRRRACREYFMKRRRGL